MAGSLKSTPHPARRRRLTTARQLHAVCRGNFRGISTMEDTLDDYYSALGRASLYLAVIGVAMGRTFLVQKMGLYIYDTYLILTMLACP